MFAVAIDGPAGAGKSSVAKAVAKKLGFLYVDTGALYRAIALYLLEQGIDPADGPAVAAALPGIKIGLEDTPQGQGVFCNGKDVSGRIRTPEVSMATSTVAAIPAVRAFLLGLQRELAQKHDVLMDGRDIGTVVLPQAQLKIFLTASPEERARRRAAQLKRAGQPVDYSQVLADIRQRDQQDSTREIAPLKPADNAILLDNSSLTRDESVAKIVDLVRQQRDAALA